MNSEMTNDQVFFTNYDFAHLEGMVRDLRATSSTNDKATIIQDYCDRNTEVGNFLKKILIQEEKFFSQNLLKDLIAIMRARR